MAEKTPTSILSSFDLEKNLTPKNNPTLPQWVFVLLLGLISTLIMVVLVRGLEDQTARSDFATTAEQRMVLLDSSIQRSVDSLFAVGAFFDATPMVSRAQFKDFVNPILDRQLSMQAFEWIPILGPDEIKPIEAFTRKEGFSNFDLYELSTDKKKQALSPRAEYFPVWYVEPMKGNEKAFGFDLGSNPVRRASIEFARKQRRSIATARITLVQETTKQFGFLLFRPVYVNVGSIGAAIAPGFRVAKEIGALKGFVLGVFRIGKMVEMQDQNKVDSAKPMQIYLFDEQGKPGEQLLYPQEGNYQSEDQLPTTAIKRSIQVGGRTWVASAIPSGSFYSVDRTASWVMLITGLLLTILGAAFQRMTLGKAKTIETIVAERTQALQDSEERLIRANHEAQETNRMKTIFLASMSHEFRTPMNAVLGLLHVLSRTPLNESQKDYVSKISGAAKRLLRLIEDILDVSRIEAGKLSIEQSAFRIETVFRDVLVAVSPKFSDTKVELILEIDPKLPAKLIGDAMRLTQVMVNLVDNAAKFTSNGQILITVNVETASERRIYLHVGVKDSGMGMPQEECDRLFQPFVQAESMNRKRYGGTGLGLSICRQLVELMGGEIHARSVLGEGSHFQFSIPLGIDDSEPLCARQSEVVGQYVLLLETHEIAGESLEHLLENMGAKVTRVSSVQSARAALEVFDGALMMIAEGFPDTNHLIDIAQKKTSLRYVILSSTGASARDSELHYEKPLLPHSVVEIFKAQSNPLEPKRSSTQRGLPLPLAQDQPEIVVDQGNDIQSQTEGSSEEIALSELQFSPDLIAHLEKLKTLLSAGDPQAEQCARELKARLLGTSLESFANTLLIQCNNYEFKKALASLEKVLQIETKKE